MYERLGHHNAILKYYGCLNRSALFQFASHGTIRQYLDSSHQRPSLATHLQSAQQATEAISFIHSKSIFHCDISYNNIFLNVGLSALLGDFAGSSIDEKKPLGWYGTSHSHPDIDDPSTKTEIFVLGRTFYEILTGKNPFEGYEMVTIAVGLVLTVALPRRLVDQITTIKVSCDGFYEESIRRTYSYQGRAVRTVTSPV